MNWRKARIFLDDLPLLKPIPVRGSKLATRRILRLECEAFDGRRVEADCAPLPGLHRETLDDCLRVAKAVLSGSDPASAAPLSLQTALEILQWQLSIDEDQAAPRQAFENSALLTRPADPKDFAALIASVRDARVCKVKVPADDLPLSRHFLKELAAAHPGRELRIDCNQALGSLDEEKTREFLRDLPLAYIEEPYADLDKLKRLARSVPLGLDESLGLDPELDALAEAWVIKPNVVGFHASLARFADPGPQQKILSNCFESYETLALYAWAYSRTVRQPRACGLGTAFYFKEPAPRALWSAAVYRSAWPRTPIAPLPSRGELIWEG